MRRAFVCEKCRARVFLVPADPMDLVPSCKEHGPMVRQANVAYRGGSTEPTDPLVPGARDFPLTRASAVLPAD